MNPAPIPQPAAQTCPNCGAAVDGNVKLCPNCGAALGVSAQSGRESSRVWFIFQQLVLLFIALVCGLFGSCTIFIGGPLFTESSGFSGDSFFFIAIGSGSLTVAAFCIWGFIRENNRRSK